MTDTQRPSIRRSSFFLNRIKKFWFLCPCAVCSANTVRYWQNEWVSCRFAIRMCAMKQILCVIHTAYDWWWWWEQRKKSKNLSNQSNRQTNTNDTFELRSIIKYMYLFTIVYQKHRREWAGADRREEEVVVKFNNCIHLSHWIIYSHSLAFHSSTHTHSHTHTPFTFDYRRIRVVHLPIL